MFGVVRLLPVQLCRRYWCIAESTRAHVSFQLSLPTLKLFLARSHLQAYLLALRKRIRLPLPTLCHSALSTLAFFVSGNGSPPTEALPKLPPLFPHTSAAQHTFDTVFLRQNHSPTPRTQCPPVLPARFSPLYPRRNATLLTAKLTFFHKDFF